jgi:hypothetical protein
MPPSGATFGCPSDRRKSKRFFFEKKKQKTLIPQPEHSWSGLTRLGHVDMITVRRRRKSFLLLFFKKEALASFSPSAIHP